MIDTTLNKTEEEKLIAWEKDHYHQCEVAGRKTPDPTGGVGYSITFSQTSVGVIKVVTCRCKKEENITDFGSW